MKCLFMPSLVIGLLSQAVQASVNTSMPSFLQKQVNDMNIDQEFRADSKAARELLSAATSSSTSRQLEENFSFIGDYAIKFQNCNSVTEWNGDEKVISRNLVRFRLCPLNSCSSSTTSGCYSKYGDYVVDLSTFVYYYMQAQSNANDDIKDYCKNDCDGDNNYDTCYEKCFDTMGGYSMVASTSGNAYDLDATEFAQCNQFDQYFYMAPYCSEDGTMVHLGLYKDDQCTVASSCDESCFYNMNGYALPYASTSMISNNCLSCAQNTIWENNGNNNARKECGKIYSNAGKCETKLYSIAYPNESACNFIEGLKYLGNNGVISGVKKSKEASFIIGLLLFSTVLLAVYIQYLSSKLSKARYHLSK